MSLLPRFRLRILVLVVLGTAEVAGPTWLADTNGLVSGQAIGQDGLAVTLGRAEARAGKYFQLFKDLTAEETKTVEELRETGEVSRSRRIVSDLIVYRSQLDNGSMTEYRDVIEVDGRPIGDRQQRVLALFERQGRAGSVRKELDRINREGSRFDLDLTVSGLTIGQGLPLHPWARALFDFERVGTERVAGRDVVVLAYRQAVPNDRFGFDLSLPRELRRTAPLYRGRLWIDAATGDLWREVREVVVREHDRALPIVVQRTQFEYRESRFGIALPARITFTALTRLEKDGEGAWRSAPRYRIRFDYGPFKQFTTSSDGGEIAGIAPEPSPEPVDDDISATMPSSGLGPEFGPDAPMGPPVAAVPARPVERGPRSSPRPWFALPVLPFAEPPDLALPHPVAPTFSPPAPPPPPPPYRQFRPPPS